MSIEMNTPSIQRVQSAVPFAGKRKPAFNGSQFSSGVSPDAAAVAKPASNLLQAYSGVRFAGSEGKKEIAGLNAKDILGGVNAASKNRFQESKSVLSFNEFLELVVEDPYRYLPTSSSYVERALKSYGVETKTVLGKEIPVYGFAKAPWREDSLTGVKGIVGQEETIAFIVNKLVEFQKHGRPNRMVAVYGPKGNGKSEIMRVIFEAVEHYSKTPEGARYTYNWVFPTGSEFPKMLPMMSRSKALEADQRLLKSKGVSKGQGEILPSNMNSHPLFLLPRETRVKLINDLKKAGKIDEKDNFDYFIQGDLDVNSREVLEGLRDKYDGDMNEVYNHVMVQSWTMSEQSGRGLAKISPSQNRDAFVQQVTPEIDWNKIPKEVRHKGMKALGGMLPLANGGIFYFDDMGRSGDPGRYVYIMVTGETGEALISANDGTTVKEQADVIYAGSVNPDAWYTMFKEGQMRAIGDRIVIAPSGHQVDYKKEMQLYEHYIESAKQEGRVIAPHVLDTFAMFMTMSRLFPVNPDAECYKKVSEKPETREVLVKALGKLDAMSKALLYAGEDLNSYEFGDKRKFSDQEKALLREFTSVIADEYKTGIGDDIFNAYESGMGLTARDGQDALQAITSLHPDQPLTVLDVFEHLAKKFKDSGQNFRDLVAATNGEQGDNLPKAKAAPFIPGTRRGGGAATAPTPFKEPAALLKDVEGHARRQAQMEIKRALGLYRDPAEYATALEKYVAHITSFVTKKNEVPKEFRIGVSSKPDTKFMEQIESAINPTLSATARKEFREGLMGRFAKMDPELSRTENIKKLFDSEIQTMIIEDEKKAQANLATLVNDLKQFWRDPGLYNGVGNEDKKAQLDFALEALEAKGYPTETIPSVVDWAFSDKFISNETYEIQRPSKPAKKPARPVGADN